MINKTSKHNSEPLLEALSYLSGRYILPSFQRDFVWKMEQIENLFNSIRLGYPLGDMLFWRINLAQTNQNVQNEAFYRFSLHFHEDSNSIAQTKVSLFPSLDYWVVLDGLQRLTSLNIGLVGSYYKREESGGPEIEYILYMLVSEDTKNPFRFLKYDETHGVDGYFNRKTGEKWFRVREIFSVKNAQDLPGIGYLTWSEEDRIVAFKERLNNLTIEFSEITEFEYNEAKSNKSDLLTE